MAVTRLQRKERRNKTKARVRVENIKLHKSRVYIKSPYAEESGIILDENANVTAPSAPVEDTTPVAETPTATETESNEETASSEA